MNTENIEVLLESLITVNQQILLELIDVKGDISEIKVGISEIIKELDWSENLSLGGKILDSLTNIESPLDSLTNIESSLYSINLDTSSIDSNTSDL
jgi:hypothetical protein